jgi:hypothetical protein
VAGIEVLPRPDELRRPELTPRGPALRLIEIFVRELTERFGGLIVIGASAGEVI